MQPANKRLAISLAIALVIAVIFWTQSRVPALGEKAQAGERTSFSGIAFDVLYPTTPAQPFVERVVKTAANWGYTNWKGMLFGFLLGAAFLSVFAALPTTLRGNGRILGANGFFRSLYGMAVGAPLSVCVNCATPIAQGMLHAGARLEVLVATLLSSPTLNAIVVTMAFSLLPFHLALAKVMASVLFIAVYVPYVVKRLALSSGADSAASCALSSPVPPTADRGASPERPALSAWSAAIGDTSREFARNMAFIVKTTLPLMVVAGLLGALIVESLPGDDLTELQATPLTLFSFAVVGTLLPVPMAFDVLAVNALLSVGLSAGLATALLFSLGIFSIYPAMILAKEISLKLSALLFAGSVMFAVVLGLGVSHLDRHLNEAAASAIDQELSPHGQAQALRLLVGRCATFQPDHQRRQCLRILFETDLMSSVTSADCQRLSPELGTSAALCRDSVALHAASAAALKDHDHAPCRSLSTPELRDECFLRFALASALDDSSMESCEPLGSQPRRQECRSAVIHARARSKSESACALDLEPSERQACFDALNGRIAADFYDISLCGLLSSPEAQRECLMHLAARRISELQDYEICRELPDDWTRPACAALAAYDRAGSTGDETVCDGLPVEADGLRCRAMARIAAGRLELEAQYMSVAPAPDGRSPAGYEPYQSTRRKPTPALQWSALHDDGEVSISFVDHAPRRGPATGRFTRSSGYEVGLGKPWEFDLTDSFEPFVYGKGIASGDFDRDGWPDLVFATAHGARLYRNNGDGSFSETARLKPDGASNSFLVAFVDVDDNGWIDLFLSTYQGGNYIFRNSGGEFAAPAKLASDGHILTISAGFADWDRDGDLDFVLGNWSYGAEWGFIPERSDNGWYRNEGGRAVPLPAMDAVGDTLSVLFSDVNDDGFADLFIANDERYPDSLYLGAGQGRFDAVAPTAHVVSRSSMNTMSYESADFNNDLLLDLFSTDMSFDPASNADYCEALDNHADRTRCGWISDGMRRLSHLDVAWCASMRDSMRLECFTAMAMKVAHRDRDEDRCENIPMRYPSKKDWCRNITRATGKVEPRDFTGTIPQEQSNKLLLNSRHGKFEDASERMGVHRSYWSWNAKAGDLDNDGWQDIYVGNGFRFGQQRDVYSNVFYHNQKGQSFRQAQHEFGLSDFTNTPSYTYVDLDLDGDLDIVTTSLLDSPSVYVNHTNDHSSISFVFSDQMANSSCVGCKVLISYESGKRHQVREIKLSGGFLSFDAPVAHFGLGEFDQIDSLKVIWSTGESWEWREPLAANRRYRIRRKASAARLQGEATARGIPAPAAPRPASSSKASTAVFR